MTLADLIRDTVPKDAKGYPSLYAKRGAYAPSARAKEIEIRITPSRSGFLGVTVLAEYSPLSSLVEAAEVERLGTDFSSDPDSVRFLVYHRSGREPSFDFSIYGEKFSVTGPPGVESREFYRQRRVLEPVLKQLGVHYRVKEPHLRINHLQKRMDLSQKNVARVYDSLVKKGYVPSVSTSAAGLYGLDWAVFQHVNGKLFSRSLHLSHDNARKPLKPKEMLKFDQALKRNGIDITKYSFVFNPQGPAPEGDFD